MGANSVRRVVWIVIALIVVLALACTSDEPEEEPAAPAQAPAPAPATQATAAPAPAPATAPAPTMMEGPEGHLRVAQQRIGLPQFYPSQLTWPNESNRWAFGVHEPPAVMTPDGNNEPRLYKGWEVGEDGITVQLREGLQFHKGWGELTAEDVAWSGNETMREDSKFVNIAFTRLHWDQWEVKDNYTVFIPWKDPAPLFYLYWRNFTAAAPTVFNTFSKKYLEQEGETPALDVGTGPFEMMEFTTEDKVELEAVQDHWRSTAHFDQLSIFEVREAATRIAQVRTGEVDITEVPLASLDDLTSGSDLKGHSMGFAGAYCGLFPTGQYYEPVDRYRDNAPIESIYTRKKAEGQAAFQEWIDDHPWIGDIDDPASMERSKKVRRARALAIDKDSIVRNVLAGHGKTLFSHRFLRDSDGLWLEEGTHDRWEKELPPQGDVARAKELLAEAGFPDGFDAELIVTTGARPEVVEISEAVAPMLENVGIRTTVSRVEIAAAIARNQEKNWQELNVGCGSREPYPLHIQLTALGGGNINIPEYKEYVDKTAELGFSLDELRKLTTEYAEIGFENQYGISVAQVDRWFVSGSNVGDWNVVGGPGGHPNSWETVTHAK